MKKIILIISLIVISINFSYSQLPNSYPFKTFLGDDGFLYVTGNKYNSNNKTYDILFEKYLDTTNIWTLFFESSTGNDKGMDITLDNQGFPVLTGYLFNETTNSNNIVIIKLDVSNGDVIWLKQYEDSREDKGLGIVVDSDNSIYVSGYITTKYLNKDFIVLKYLSNGNLISRHLYNNPDFNSDDVATDILIDEGFVYAAGYTSGGRFMKDVMMLTINKSTDAPTDTVVYRKDNTNEMPTAFVLSHISRSVLTKSRASISCITDNGVNPHYGTDFLTLTLGGGDFMKLRWARIFNGSGNNEDVPTAMTADKHGNVYVTGYSNRNFGSNYDFATIKYTRDTGGYGWGNQVEYFDYGQSEGVDKASSIKVWQNQIYVSGSCQEAPSGYKIISYEQSETGVTRRWDATYFPSFTNDRSFNDMNKAATMEVDTTTGKVWLIATAWNQTDQLFALRTFDKDGNILGTVENTERNRTQIESDNLELKEVNSYTCFELKQNYPNPFNPKTVIHYTVPSNVRGQMSNVKLTIYNSVGQEVATLVNESKPSGNYSVNFNAGNLASGIYFYKLESGEFRDIKRMILLK